MNDTSISQQKKMEEFLYSYVNFPPNSNSLLQQMKPTYVDCCQKEKWLRIAFTVQNWELNANGSLPDGLIFTAMDNTLGILSYYFCGQTMVTTVNLTVNYIKPVKEGDTLILTGRLCAKNGALVQVMGEGRLQGEEEMVLTATGTFLNIGSHSLAKAHT